MGHGQRRIIHRAMGSGHWSCWLAAIGQLPLEGDIRACSAAGSEVISYLTALLAAVTNATSNALNRKAAREAPGRDQFRLRLIAGLLRRRAAVRT